ncbi:hypothetical protein I3760_11G150700 [Carya illinoinensis]|uniref:Uncharacterized protein n=1 Tax=Carya illinoinensis TaxID=32201 RepID=A0A922J0X0_CARIL|nr:hypothetical protein I3760_11G150700 [Carya illinoinensis]KAG6688973.1 hypothetical protein I3842_11G153400 [Carya illinoinensis]
MELTRLVGSLSCCIFLVMMVISVAAQLSNDDSSPPVLDTTGLALKRDIEYYIKPPITDNGGRFTLIDRNGSCPLYVGQENVLGSDGFPVIFTPFVEGETLIRESRDTILSSHNLFTINYMEVACNFFKIQRIGARDNIYNIVWCPTEACNFCKFIFGTAGSLVENG